MNLIKDLAIAVLCAWIVAVTAYIVFNPNAWGQWEAERDTGYFEVMVTEHEQ